MPELTALRPATAVDIDAVSTLLQPEAKGDVILPRSRDDLFEHLSELLVVERNHHIVGCAALHVYSRNLAEIRSLVVAPSTRHLGLGRMLVKGCEAMACRLAISQLFALTYVTDFFLQLGFAVIPRESLPHKVWTVCIHCHNFASCNETAVHKTLNIKDYLQNDAH
ncbi:MAG: N-acetyltransferase [Mariprofundales bacterium]|nr:N-acetyltransferase [Mariprofundales bacterium]